MTDVTKTNTMVFASPHSVRLSVSLGGRWVVVYLTCQCWSCRVVVRVSGRLATVAAPNAGCRREPPGRPPPGATTPNTKAPHQMYHCGINFSTKFLPHVAARSKSN